MTNIITCRTCKKQKTEESYGFYAGRRRKNCDSCREWLREYNKKNRDHLLEIRRFRYHTDKDRKVAKANAEYMRTKRGDPKRHRQMMDAHRKRMYGLSPEQYDNMMKVQGNKCAMCAISFSDIPEYWNRPCVDHCHRTNKVRGILCRKCNVSLSYIENRKLLESALRYLRINGVEDKEPLT